MTPEQLQEMMADDVNAALSRYNARGLGVVDMFHVLLNCIGTIACNVQENHPEKFEAVFRAAFIKDTETMLSVLRAPKVREAAERQAEEVRMLMMEVGGRTS